MRPYICLIVLLFCSWNSTFAQCPPATSAGVHVVQSGQTLFGIARNYGVSVAQLRQYNRLEASDNIHPCDQLVVFPNSPQTAAPATYSNQPAVMNTSTVVPRGASTFTTAPVRQAGNQHIVRAGETMAQLARVYGYTEERFREFNGYASIQEPMAGSRLSSEHCNCTASNNQATPTTFSRTPVLANEVSNAFNANPGGTAVSTNMVARSPALPTTATNAVSDDRSYMLADESAMINEINLMRSNPAGYVTYVEEFVRNYPAKFGRVIDRRYVNSLISDLINSPRLSRLVAHPCLYQVARNHGQYLRSINGFSHTGPGGSMPNERTQANCPSVQLGTSSNGINGGQVGNENLVAGFSNAREAIIGLMIDEGLAVPGHRKTLLAPEWRYVAASNFGTIGGFPNNFVQLFGR